MKSKAVLRNNPRKASKTAGETRSSSKNDFSVVAIGASAGGIEACKELVEHLPSDAGMAFVVIQHLDPKHESILAELLSKKTEMLVQEVTDGTVVQANHIYVIPPNAELSISNHKLQLGPREESRGMHMPIDHFMRTLAEERGNRAIGVILSGSGSDGTLGLAEIQAHGGVTFAQDDSSAKYNNMPRSAVAAGCVDHVLPPRGIARELERLARHPYVARDHSADVVTLAPADNNGLGTIFHLLRRSTGVDFAHYRQTTILRRIQRRMVVQKIDKLDEYVKFVHSNPPEIKSLYQDMLINVTSFFRNPHVFDALKSKVFPAMLRNRLPGSSIRIWNPGCASGEETYSLAIALLETLGDKALQVPIQFFGTDVSESSIIRARSGVYPENIQGDVSAERLRIFFTKADHGYHISKSIRDVCIFAQHNVLNDPPFSQMDLVCCRNLLIYLEPMLQSKVISLFHYASRPSGYLVLGGSEGVGVATQLFVAEDRAHRIFARKSTLAPLGVSFSLNRSAERAARAPADAQVRQPDSSWNYVEAQKEFDRRLLSQFAPATVFVNEDLEIIHTRGNVNRYLKLAPGRASLSILKMAREGLLLDLRNAIGRARKENTTVRKQNVRIKNGNGDGGTQAVDSSLAVNFEVIPINLENQKELYFMIVFQEAAAAPLRKGFSRAGSAAKESQASLESVAKLERELVATKEYLQSVIETQEATNEELQSANEEILSSNEELQSTNEELETAKEELQSANEELSTVNDELRNRNVEIAQGSADLANLFSSIDIAVITIGNDLTIRGITPQAQKMLGVIPGDIGRPLANINPTIEIPDLQALVSQVMSGFSKIEKELTSSKGARCLLRILPYYSAEKKIDGVVITIVDIPPLRARMAP